MPYYADAIDIIFADYMLPYWCHDAAALIDAAMLILMLILILMIRHAIITFDCHFISLMSWLLLILFRHYIDAIDISLIISLSIDCHYAPLITPPLISLADAIAITLDAYAIIDYWYDYWYWCRLRHWCHYAWWCFHDYITLMLPLLLTLMLPLRHYYY